MSDSIAIVTALYDAFAAGDVPGVLGAFDPDITWVEAESGPLAKHNPYHGPLAIAEGVFMRLAGEIEDFSAVPERITGNDQTVIAEGRYRGTVRATGKALDAQFAHIWQISGGKLSHFQQYTDTYQWRETYAG